MNQENYRLSKEQLIDKIFKLAQEFNALETPKKKTINVEITELTEKVPAFYILAKRLPRQEQFELVNECVKPPEEVLNAQSIFEESHH